MPGSPPTRRVIDTLEFLSGAVEALTIAELADALAISRPTMAAILSELALADWVERDSMLRYRPGPRLGALVGGGTNSVTTPEVTALIEKLATDARCGATLSRMTGDRMTVLAKVHSQARPVPGLGIGQPVAVGYPAGAAVMAWRTTAEQNSWLRAHGAATAKRRSVLDVVRTLGYSAYRPVSSDATLIESLADLLGAVGPMLIDPSVRRSATRQLAELGSRAYTLDQLDTEKALPISYLAAPVFHRGSPDFELQLGVLRSAVQPQEREQLGATLVATASAISESLSTHGV